MKAITVEALSKTFSGGTVAVDGIRFSFSACNINIMNGLPCNLKDEGAFGEIPV